MTNERAKSELMQIYMSLSEEKKKALDVLMQQADGEKVNCIDCERYMNGCRIVMALELKCDRFKPKQIKTQADGEYISKKAVLDTTVCEGISCNECSFNTCEDGQAGCLLKERVDKLPPVAIPNKTEIEVILQRFYNEEISCADMVQEMINLGFVIER